MSNVPVLRPQHHLTAEKDEELVVLFKQACVVQYAADKAIEKFFNAANFPDVKAFYVWLERKGFLNSSLFRKKNGTLYHAEAIIKKFGKDNVEPFVLILYRFEERLRKRNFKIRKKIELERKQLSFGQQQLPAETTTLEDERKNLESERAALATERKQLETEREEFEAERKKFEKERAEFEAERMTFEDTRIDTIASRAPDFPEIPLNNPERRQTNLRLKIADAPVKSYEKREISVRTSAGAIDPATRMRVTYTNRDGQMVCQICREEMPFKFRRKQGVREEHYFEAVEIFTDKYLPRELEAQYLALCPFCAAKYKNFVKNNEAAMNALRDAILNAKGADGFEAPITLDEPAAIRFVATHLFDLQTILQTIRDEKR